MAWRQKEKPRTSRATRESAEQFRLMDPPHDRALSERRLQIYERMMKAGEFRPITWAKCFCLETNQEYRVNGQHTATLLSKLDPTPDVYVTVETYEADTLEDVSKLWSTFDSRIGVRTTSDINGGFAAAIPELREYSGRFINLIVTALSYHKWHDGYTQVPAAERAELLFDSADFALWVEQLLGSGDTKQFRHLHRGPVVAAMYATWLKSKKAATEFWQAVRDDIGRSPSLPDRRLSRWLLSMNVQHGQGARTARASRMARQREFYVRCIHAWNAWRKNVTSDLKYYPQAKIPCAS